MISQPAKFSHVLSVTQPQMGSSQSLLRVEAIFGD